MAPHLIVALAAATLQVPGTAPTVQGVVAQRLGSNARRAWLSLACGVVAIGGVSAAPAQAATKQLKRYGTAVVRSVDGAAELTIVAGRRNLRVHLMDVDAPRPGECGAEAATAALKGFVRRAPKRLRYELIVSDGGRVLKTAGRYEVLLRYGPQPAPSGGRNLAADLFTTEWARQGAAIDIDRRFETSAKHDPNDVYAYNGPGDGDVPNAPRALRGVWATCGGRLHLPAGQTPQAPATAPWTVTADGVTTAIGPITLPTTLAPGSTLTFGKLAELTPLEFTAGGKGACSAYIPALGIVATAWNTRSSCRVTDVESIYSWGPLATRTTLGLKVGDPASALQNAFPEATVQLNDEDWMLASAASTWAWKTFAQAAPSGPVALLATSAKASATYEVF